MGASRSRPDGGPTVVMTGTSVVGAPAAESVVTGASDGAEPPDGVSALDLAPGSASPSASRYVVIEDLGPESMGVVRAYDPRLRREVALKSKHADARSQERSFDEAQAMAQLAHPNVLAVYDVAVDGDDVVIAMEYVRGMTLQSWLGSPRPWRDVVEMFVAAGRGLAAAHAAGLVHRDFKPANVLVGDDGRPRVTHFGLARAADGAAADRCAAPQNIADEVASTRVGEEAIGTPEPREGSTLGAAADQYAFCVALWTALTGRRPFGDSEDERVATARRVEPPPWPRQIRVPVRVREALARGLAPDPDDRWPTLDSLLHALSLAPRRRDWVMPGAGGAAIVLGSALLWWNAVATAQRCTGAAAQLSEAWSPAHRDEIARAFAQSGVSYAGDVWQRIEPRLQAHASEWMNMHTEACEATAVRGEQTPAILDLRMACLQQAKAGLAAVSEVLLVADAPVVERAHALVDSLPDIARCADIEALQAEVPPPPANDRAVVDAARSELARVRALGKAGKYGEALALVEPLAVRVTSIPYPPLHTEVTLELAAAVVRAGTEERAEHLLRRALRMAVANRQWAAAQDAAGTLVHLVGWSQTRPLEGLAYAETAAGLLALGDPKARAGLHSNVGNVLERLGRLAEAEAELRAAVAVARESSADAPVTVATYHANLGLNLRLQGRLAEAEQELRIGLSLREDSLGPEHPLVARARCSLGHTFFEQGRYADAEHEQLQALAVMEQALGPDHLETASVRATLGLAMAAQGREHEAVVELEAALAVQRRALGSDSMDVSFLVGSLGKILMRVGREAEAEARMREAVAIAERALPQGHPTLAEAHALMLELLLRQRRYAEAEATARRVLTALHEAESNANPTLPEAQFQLGHALHGQQRYVEAEAAFRTALQMAAKIMPDSPRNARLHNGLGATLLAQGRDVAAEAEYRAALQMVVPNLGPAHAFALAAQRGIVSALRERGRCEEAQAVLDEAIASLQNAPEVTDPKVIAFQAELDALPKCGRRSRPPRVGAR